MIAWQCPPLETALVPVRIDAARNACEAAHGLDTVDILHVPLEVVQRAHDLEVDAAFRHGLGDHRQYVHADPEVIGDFSGIDIVDRPGPKFRHALMLVAHPDLGGQQPTDAQENDRDAQ